MRLRETATSRLAHFLANRMTGVEEFLPRPNLERLKLAPMTPPAEGTAEEAVEELAVEGSAEEAVAAAEPAKTIDELSAAVAVGTLNVG